MDQLVISIKRVYYTDTNDKIQKMVVQWQGTKFRYCKHQQTSSRELQRVYTIACTTVNIRFKSET